MSKARYRKNDGKREISDDDLDLEKANDSALRKMLGATMRHIEIVKRLTNLQRLHKNNVSHLKEGNSVSKRAA